MRNSSSTRLHVRHKIWVTFPFSVFLKQGQLNFQISLGFNFSSTFIFVLLKNVLNMENCRIHKPRPTKCVVISEMDVNQRKTLLTHFRAISDKVETCDFSELVHLIDCLIYTLSSSLKRVHLSFIFLNCFFHHQHHWHYSALAWNYDQPRDGIASKSIFTWPGLYLDCVKEWKLHLANIIKDTYSALLVSLDPHVRGPLDVICFLKAMSKTIPPYKKIPIFRPTHQSLKEQGVAI